MSSDTATTPVAPAFNAADQRSAVTSERGQAAPDHPRAWRPRRPLGLSGRLPVAASPVAVALLGQRGSSDGFAVRAGPLVADTSPVHGDAGRQVPFAHHQ